MNTLLSHEDRIFRVRMQHTRSSDEEFMPCPEHTRRLQGERIKNYAVRYEFRDLVAVRKRCFELTI